MLETGTSGLMSGDEKRGDVTASVPALVLDSTIAEGVFRFVLAGIREIREGSGASRVPHARTRRSQ
jgi:hypothetical protein